MTILSSAQKALVNTRPQSSDLYLSIFEPPIALSCRVNDSSIAKGERTITYDSVTAGSYSLIEANFIMLVGTSAGSDDKGRIRVKSATASTITVQANSHIDWANNDYLTVLRYIEMVPLYQRIIQDPANPMNTIWYKDYDVAYTDQNSTLGSFVCMGSHYAGFVGDNVFYSASGTSNVKGDALTYDWFIQGASTTGSSSHTPGNISYSNAGHYVTRLEVDNASGGSDTSYRFISLYDRPGEGSNPPILQWEMDELRGSRQANGYQTRIRIFEDIEESKIRPNAVVVLFGEDWYGNSKGTFGGNGINREKIFYVGYIKDGSINWDYKAGVVEFDVVSPTEIMKSIQTFSIDVSASTDPAGQAATDPDYPSGWTLLLDLDVKRMVYHYLRWHSTVLQVNDIETDGRAQFNFPLDSFSTDRSSLFDGVYTEINSGIIANIVSDRQGKIWLEVEAQAIDNSSGSFATSMVMEDHFWMSEPSLEIANVKELSYLEMGGIAYHGAATDDFNAYLACAPGEEPGLQGKMEEKQGLALMSQEQLNELVGNIYAWRNSKYPRLDYYLSSPFKNIDIAPQEILSVNLDEDDTPRKITFSEKPFIPQEASWRYDPEGKTLLQSITLHETTQGFDGDTIIIPDEPPDPVDPDDPPVPPIDPPWEPPVDPDPIVIGKAFVATSSEVRTSDDFGDSPTWDDRTGDLPSITILDACIDYQNYTTAFVASSNAIYKTTNLSNASPTWTQVYDPTGDFTDPKIKRVVMSQSSSDYVYGLMYARESPEAFTVSEYLLVSNDGGTTWDEKLITSGISLAGDMVILTNKGIYYTESNPTGTNSWVDFNDGLPEGIKTNAINIINSVTYDAVRDKYYAINKGTGSVWSADLGGEWGIVQNGDEAITKLNDAGHTCGLGGDANNPIPTEGVTPQYTSIFVDEAGDIYCFGGAYHGTDTGCKNYKGIFYSFDGLETLEPMIDCLPTAATDDHSATRYPSSMRKIYDRLIIAYRWHWGLSSAQMLSYTDDNGEDIEGNSISTNVGPLIQRMIKADEDRLILYLGDDDALWISDDEGETTTYYDAILPLTQPGFWADYSYVPVSQYIAANGSNLMACSKSYVGEGVPSISTDNGDTWTTGTTAIEFDSKPFWTRSVHETLAFDAGFYVGSDAGNAGYQSHGVVYTPDHGVTWYDRTGDLMTVAGCTGYDGLSVYKFIKVGDVSINEIENGLLTALDVGQQSITTVYVGSPDGIYRTTNAGGDFTLILTDYDANDIECFVPQPSSDPQCKCFIDMDGGAYTTFDNSLLGNAWHRESVAQKMHLRISSNEDNSFPTFVLSHTGNDIHNMVKCTKDSEITRLSSIVRGRSIHQYDSGIYWLERSDICYSTDDGMTKTSAKGDWSGYSNGVVIEAIE
jgi:hypothetical protein